MGEREIGLGMLGWTNGDKEHEVQTERTEASLDAVAAALKVDRLAPKPAAPAAPAIPVEELEAAIEASQPAHEPEGPAEPPALVQAPGEMPEPEDQPVAPSIVVAGEMAAHEPIVEAPVSFAEPPADEDDSQEIVSDDEELPPMALRPPVTIDAEAREITPEPEAVSEMAVPAEPRPPKAAGPSSAPGVPYKPQSEPAD